MQKLAPSLRFLALGGISVLLAGALSGGCAAGGVTQETTGSGSGASTSSSGAGGTGASGGMMAEGGMGGDPGLCAQDCSMVVPPDCHKSVCNEGAYPGPVGSCVIVPVDDGESCDDGVFCTIGDTCQAGVCTGGGANDCGMAPPACTEVVCNESTQSCSTSPANNGDPCQTNDLCLVGSTCINGNCGGGTQNDCFFQPVPDECHVSVCDPTDGVCKPQPGNDGGACTDMNDLCSVANTCLGGMCQGGVPKDCSNLTAGCNIGVCDTTSGQCVQQAVMNGGLCDDLDACTTGEICTNGSCTGGTAVTTCVSGDFCCPSNCTANNDLDCATCDWVTSVFPVSYSSTNSVGDMTFDDSCHLYWSSDGGEVFRMNRNTSSPVLLHDFNQITRAMTFHPGLNLLFMAAASTIYSMPTSGGTPTALPTGLSTYMNGMEVAPSGWGTHGGKLIVGHNSGAIYAVDPITGQSTVIGSTSQEVSDIVFDGMTLYAAVYDSQTVYTVSPTGTFTTFATPGCSPDGLAVKSGQTLYIACGSNDTLHKATIPGGTVTSMGSATLNGGWAPAGLIFDGLDTLIVMEDTATLFHYVD